MIKIEAQISNDESAKRFVDICEAEFHDNVVAVADEVVGMSRVITLTGPTCSGKTTAASILTDEIERRGKIARVLSIDDFYRDNLVKGKVNLEGPEAIDIPYFTECVEKLLKGQKVNLPVFDFKTGKRAGAPEYTPRSNDIYIFEGIQAMYPEITSVLKDNLKESGYKSVFINVWDDVSLNGVELKRSRIRFYRRLLRDYLHRKTSLDMTLELWKGVRKNEKENILPNSESADCKISSFLPYEPMIIARKLMPVMKDTMDFDSTGLMKIEFEESYEKLKAVRCDCVRDGMIPFSSLIREFIF